MTVRTDFEASASHRQYAAVNGQYAPSVTTLLSLIRKPGLERWRGNVGNAKADEIMRSSARYGTYVHNVAEYVNVHGVLPDDVDDIARDDCASYLAWHQSHVRRLVAQELKLYHVADDVLPFSVVGTLDVIVETIGGKTVLLDLKTSRGIQESHRLQLQMYRFMLKDTHAIDDAGILHVRDGATSFHRVPYSPSIVDLFTHLAGLYAALSSLGLVDGRGNVML